MKRFYPLILIIISLLAACSSIPGAPATVLTQENAAAFTESALQSNAAIIATLANPGTVAASPLSTRALPEEVKSFLELSELSTAQASSECSVETGDATDNDNDGIPVKQSVQFDCTETSEGGSISIKGTISVEDKNDNDPASGFIMTVNNYEFSVSSQGQSASFIMNLNYDLSIVAGTYKAKYTYDLNFTSPEDNARIKFDYTYSYTPDDLSRPFDAGIFNIAGSLNIQSAEENWSINTSTSNAHYSSTCESGFDSGVVTFSDSAGNSVVVTYNACNNVTATYNGQVLSDF